MTLSLDMTPDNNYHVSNPPQAANEGTSMNEETQSPATMVADLKKLVTRKNLVHRKVAAKIGVTVTTFSRWMNGHTAPTSEPVLLNISRFIKNNS